MISIEILNDLITNYFNHFFIFQDIYNAKKKIKTQRLSIDIFMKILHETFDFIKWILFHRYAKDIDRLKRLFLVNKYVVKFLFKNFEILVLNNTCKVKQYELSMFAFLKQTSLNISFYWDLIFINTKDKANLTWMMKNIDLLYRSLNFQFSLVIVFISSWVLFEIFKSQYSTTKILFFIYHMNKKIRKHCKHSFNDDKIEQEWQKFMKHWFEIVHAFIRKSYKLVWRNLKNKYERFHRDEILYLQKIWFDASWRRCFNNYHINDILYFNVHKFSRIEDDHRILK